MTPPLPISDKDVAAGPVPAADQPGFTIMEVMVVVAIFGLLMAASTLTLRNITRSELRSAARRTASAMRFAFDRATMTGMYIRLAFNLDKGEIWVETSTDRVSLRSARDQQANRGKESEEASEQAGKPAKPKPMTKPLLPLLGGNKSEPGSMGGEPGEGPQGIDAKALTEEWEADLAPAERPQPHFQPMKGLLSKKIKLAQTISLSAVMTPRMKEPLEKGMAYVYFFPQGHSEPAIIHFVDRASEHYSVVLHPLTGQAKVFPCLYRIPSDFGFSDDKLSRSAPDPCRSRHGT